jgi:hypothetical protein
MNRAPCDDIAQGWRLVRPGGRMRGLMIGRLVRRLLQRRAPRASDEVLGISAALREDHAAVDRALARIGDRSAEHDVGWLATETAGYLEREAQRRHSAVRRTYEARNLRGDAGVLSHAVRARLRRRLLRARRWHRRITAAQARAWTDAELLRGARQDLGCHVR